LTVLGRHVSPRLQARSSTRNESGKASGRTV